jgi:hypothetical protein
MSASDVPGWNTRATPASSSARSSSSGTMPPTITPTSLRPAARSASMSRGTIRWSVASDETPITSTSSSCASFTTAAISCQGGV